MSETFTKINYDKPVKVYRNLKHGRSAPRLYSVVQNNKVVAHRNNILLTDCKFVVRETGRQKGIKN